jgi:hypothetical protein
MRRSVLLSTTAFASMLVSMVAPAVADSSDAPAVAQTNFKIDAGGGEVAHQGLGYLQGSLSVPLGHSFGLQVDGAGGDWDHKSFESVSGHLFWRDPSEGLFGLYGTYIASGVPDLLTFDVGSGTTTATGHSHLYRGGAEAELYLGQWSLEGRAGLEGEAIGGTQFFDRTNIAFYPGDDFRLALGQIYTGDRDNASLAAEYQVSDELGLSLFAEGVTGNGTTSVFGGLRFYFGDPGKSLIRRQREDDPGVSIPEDLLGIAAGVKHKTTTCRNNEGVIIPCG